MSTWNIGKDDISEQTQALKNAASSKETENAGLRNQLLKRDTELAELKSTLNETLRKLSREADRALHLEADLTRVSEDLTHHRLSTQNAEQALAAANAKLSASELIQRELQNHIEILSGREDVAKDGTSRLEKEKKALEARVRELDTEVRQLSAPSAIPRKAGRARSSSVSMANFKNTALEQELSDVRAALAVKNADLRSANEQLNRMQTQLIQAQNEGIATEKKMQRQLDDLQSLVDEKEEELETLIAQQEGGGREREEELLKRVEEDEAKIMALEMLVGDSHEVAQIRDALIKAERQMDVEIERAEQIERRCVNLVKEKGEALEDLENAKIELQDRNMRIQALVAEARNFSTANLIHVDGRAFDSGISPAVLSYQSTPVSRTVKTASSTSDEVNAAVDIAILLGAIDRLRDERDSLRRDLDFLENESRFAIQALEAKVASAVPATNSVKYHDQEKVTSEHKRYTRRLSLATTALAVVIDHLQLQVDTVSADFTSVCTRLADTVKACGAKEMVLEELRVQLDTSVRDLETVKRQRSELLDLLELNAQTSTDEAERLTSAYEETKDALDQAEAQLSYLTQSYEDVESQRNSLHLQVTNLQSDLDQAQQDLTDAETRYSALQTQQLSSMSSSDVAQSLREQIEELELRVLRRTEQIGIHQHDIKRLETNLRLQEERVGEMTSELETVAAQKEAMVEDCADAREARDEAIQKCESLELEVEGLEGRLETAETQRQQETTTLVRIIAETVTRSRSALSLLRRSFANDDSAAADTHQVTLALAVAQIELKHKSASLCISDQTKADLQSKANILQEQLIAALDALEQERDEVRKLSAAEPELDIQTITQLRVEHAEQLADLQKKLDAASCELQEARDRHADTNVYHQQELEEANQSRKELECRLVTVSEHARAELAEAHADELSCLQKRIDIMDEDLRNAIRSRNELETVYQATTTELAQTKEDYEARLSKAALQSLNATQQLEDDLANSKFKHAEDVGELEGQLKQSAEEIGRLQVRLQEQVHRHDQDHQTHLLALQAKVERCQQAEALETELRQEIAATRTQLEQTRTVLQSLEAEKCTLQIESTNLAAEIQRTISLNRFLESEVKACESRNVSLQEALELTRAELSRSERSGQEAGINLSLQIVRHDQIVSGLRQELATLQANPRLDDVVAELEERNREMDELLKSKCTEIEENDDRILEMLKEKKKLTTKVESLTRKVQGLQTKLAATKDLVPIGNIQKVVSPSNMPSSSFIPPVPPIPTQETRTPTSRPMLNRVVSGPASLSRPKTPERRLVQPTVFKVKTPEKSAPLFIVPDATPLSSSSSSIGKKRARPDEFDAVSVPVRALYADEQQERENATPRLRRALDSVQMHAGFTPVRHTSTRTVQGASPGRRVTTGAAGISDMTNSPLTIANQSTKAGKRSWLGKIRGVSSQTGSRTPSSRPGVFERVPRS